MVRGDNGKTRLKDLRQSGSLKLVFPAIHRADAEAVIVNTAGGVTGGDRFNIGADLGEDTELTLTTQAAERAYRAQPGEVADIATTLTVGAGARLQWLPQELILFDSAALCRRLYIELAQDARLLMVEPMVFGRAAMGERLNSVTFEDRIRITRDGAPLYLDGMTLRGDAASHLACPAVAGGASAMASLVYIAPDAPAHLSHIRALLPETGGASLIGEDMLVMRLLATDSFEMRQSLVPILDHLSQNTLPTSWRL